MWKIKYHKAVSSDLKKLPSDIQHRFFSIMKILKNSPESVRLKPIKGYPGKYAIRMGDYRIVIEPKIADRALIVWMVGHRRAVYKRMTQRLR